MTEISVGFRNVGGVGGDCVQRMVEDNPGKIRIDRIPGTPKSCFVIMSPDVVLNYARGLIGMDDLVYLLEALAQWPFRGRRTMFERIWSFQVMCCVNRAGIGLWALLSHVRKNGVTVLQLPPGRGYGVKRPPWECNFRDGFGCVWANMGCPCPKVGDRVHVEKQHICICCGSPDHVLDRSLTLIPPVGGAPETRCAAFERLRKQFWRLTVALNIDDMVAFHEALFGAWMAMPMRVIPGNVVSRSD